MRELASGFRAGPSVNEEAEHPDPLFIQTMPSAARNLETAIRAIVHWGVALRTGERPHIPEGAFQRVGLPAFGDLLRRLDASIPPFSARYAAHMLPDVAVPALLAQFAATFLNQNNCATEASTITSVMEREVVAELRALVGFPTQRSLEVAGRITTSGSIANFDALWAARRAQAILTALLRARLQCASVQQLAAAVGGPLRGVLRGEIDALSASGPRAVQYIVHLAQICRCGECVGLLRAAIQEAENEVPRRSFILCSSSAHQSIPKAAAALGFAGERVILVPLDATGAMRVSFLEQQLAGPKPICAIVAVFGSTDLGATDDMGRIVAARRARQHHGKDAHLHVDAAWGGYFLSGGVGTSKPLRRVPRKEWHGRLHSARQDVGRADTVTIDPHKGAFVPYPAGAVLFRNEWVMSLLDHQTPVLNHDQFDASMGRWGIDGSRPGSAAAAVMAAHASLKLHAGGLGTRLQRVAEAARELCDIAHHWHDPANRLYAAPVIWPGSESREMPLGVAGLLFNYGSRWAPNRDVDRLNKLNQAIFEACSRQRADDPEPEIYVTRSELNRNHHGPDLFRSIASRLACPPIEAARRLVFLVITPIWAARANVHSSRYAAWLFAALARSARRVAAGRGATIASDYSSKQ